jgi:hypothetical protein
MLETGSKTGPNSLDDLGLPKSVVSEIQGLSAEEQNMILGAVGLSPSKKRKQKQSRHSGAGTGETAAQRRARRKAAQERQQAAARSSQERTSKAGKAKGEPAKAKGHPAPPPKPQGPTKDGACTSFGEKSPRLADVRARNEEAFFR